MTKWHMMVELTIENNEEESINGVLYMDDEYGYYERTATVCCSSYGSTFRFNRDKMGDVLKYIADKSPIDLEMYIKSLDGYEWIESDHDF